MNIKTKIAAVAIGIVAAVAVPVIASAVYSTGDNEVSTIYVSDVQAWIENSPQEMLDSLCLLYGQMWWDIDAGDEDLVNSFVITTFETEYFAGPNHRLNDAAREFWIDSLSVCI